MSHHESDPGIVMQNPSVKTMPEGARVILFGGDLDAHNGPVQAAWAFDVLKYTDPLLHLVFAGEGSDRRRVRELAASLGYDDDRVRFVLEGERAYWLSHADLLWLTRSSGGVRSALAALAHGVPVIAMRTAELTDLVRTPGAIVFVPPGDRIALASATWKWFRTHARETRRAALEM